jgi:hypothetical protein
VIDLLISGVELPLVRVFLRIATLAVLLRANLVSVPLSRVVRALRPVRLPKSVEVMGAYM